MEIVLHENPTGARDCYFSSLHVETLKAHACRSFAWIDGKFHIILFFFAAIKWPKQLILTVIM